ncbi:MAG: hypothetical protein ABW168_03440 [Sedimenticola sp.]
MSEPISWSLSAGSASGGGVNISGKTEADATTVASLTLAPKMNQAKELAMQIGDVSKVELLIISSTINDGSIEIKADGASAIALSGPLVLFGPSVKLFAGDLDKLTVQNKSQDNDASAVLEILISRKLQ